MPIIKFILLIICAIILTEAPYISIPAQWLSTYFHELSHAITAKLTGGNVERLALDIVGSGHVLHSGSFLPFLVSLAGYCGPFIAGYIFWILSKKESNTIPILVAFIVTIIITTIYMVRDIETLIIIICLISGSFLFWKFHKNKYASMILKFIATLMIVRGYIDISYLISHPGPNDATSLEDKLFLPDFVWISVWYLFGGFITFLIVKSIFKKEEKRDPQTYEYDGDF